MRVRKPVPRAGGGNAPLSLVIQAVTLVVVVGIAASVLGTLWHPYPTGATAAAAPSASSSEPSASAASAAVKPTGGYKKVELAQIAYGQADEQVGLSVQKESRPRGPSSIAIGPDGAIYVADDANERVQAYSSAGKHLGAIKVDEPIRDLVVGDGTDLFVLGSRADVLTYDRVTRQPRGQMALEGTPAKSLGTLRMTSATLSLESPQQVTYPLATGSGTSLSVLSPAEQQRQSKKGGKSESKAYYSTSFRDGGHVYRQDEQGKVIQDVALGLPNALSVVFLDEDKSGSFYVQVESRGDDGAVGVEVWRFDKQGTPTAAIPLEPVTYLPMVRSVVVAGDGTVYEAIPSKDSLRLVKWVAP